MTDTTKPNGDRDRPSVREAALDAITARTGGDHLEAAHKKSGKTSEAG